MEFKNEVIDGQSTVAENLAKTNRNFMLLQELLKNGVSITDLQNYLKVADIVNDLVSTATDKPLSALQGKNLNDKINGLVVDNLTTQDSTKALSALQGYNLSQSLNNKVSYKWTGELTIADLNNANYPYPYETSMFIKANELGNLPEGWYLFKYYKHVDRNGYGAQEAFCLNNNTGREDRYYRNSNISTWGRWNRVINDIASLVNSPSDANNAITNLDICYLSSQCANKPPVIDCVMLALSYNNATWCVQIAFDWRNNKIFMRSCQNGIWTAWVEK